MRKWEKSVVNSAEIEFHRWTPSGYSWEIPAAQFTDYWIHCSLLIFNHYLYEHPQHSSDSGGLEKDFLSLSRCRSVNVRFFFCSKKCKGLRVWESRHRRLSHHTSATCYVRLLLRLHNQNKNGGEKWAYFSFFRTSSRHLSWTMSNNLIYYFICGCRLEA